MKYLSGSSAITRKITPDDAPLLGKCYLVMKDVGSLNPSIACAGSGYFSKHRITAWTDATRSFSAQVMREDRKIWFLMAIAWPQEDSFKWLFILLMLKLPASRGKELL